jgi:hypothetical protein
MSRRRNFTPEEKADMRRLKADGWTYKRLARAFATSPAGVHAICNPKPPKPKEPKKKAGEVCRAAYKPSPEDYAARLSEIPPDTRTLTARLMGDPIPGRRAIDKRSALGVGVMA